MRAGSTLVRVFNARLGREPESLSDLIIYVPNPRSKLSHVRLWPRIRSIAPLHDLLPIHWNQRVPSLLEEEGGVSSGTGVSSPT
eukprot:SAG22_NODE_10864_length_513_cov_0.618357_1_plen_83_part_10